MAELGAMGWRLGLPMCKVMRDRHGPKGQWVRWTGYIFQHLGLERNTETSTNITRAIEKRDKEGGGGETRACAGLLAGSVFSSLWIALTLIERAW